MEKAQSFSRDVDRGVHVAIMVALTAGTRPLPDGQVMLFAEAADVTQLTAGEPLADDDKGLVSPLRFVFEHSTECAMRGIVPGLAVSA